MNAFVHKQYQRIKNALSGITYAGRYDHAFRVHIAIGIFLLAFAILLSPLTEIEYLFLFLSWMLILITELQNSAFEEALDRLHPEAHEKIGRSKNMAAGSVLLAAFFTGIVILWILVHYFGIL